ncbi:hypothetical protein BLA29_002016 [Euroglyphus maynei]|uniref:IFT122 second beta-propeller domain-containing protein n=1 Tax=Euroglyphus maynei TaxID=6958 RepID=A0A1Y3BF11_EURMA|nr:hypothetical protein BLA29_002016 [Euroglyphus maynei]
MPFGVYYSSSRMMKIDCQWWIGRKNVQERNLNHDPLFISSFLGNEFFLIGGTNKQVTVYTVEGMALETITTKESWIWCCKTLGNRMIQLAKRIVIYETNEGELNYRIKEKMNIEIDCTILMLCSSNLIVCHENQIQSLNFNGQLEKEWNFKCSVTHIKSVGGVPTKESLLIGLKDGQVLMIFLSNIIPVELIKINNPIQYIDISMKRQKVAIIDDKNNCSVYDLRTEQLMFEEPSVNAVVWNNRFEDLLCFAGSGFIAIKMNDVPMQTIEFCDQARFEF